MFEIFSPPIFPDKEKTAKARLFYKFSIGAAVIFTFQEIIQILLLPENTSRWLSLIIAINIANIFLLYLNKNKSTRFASIIWIVFIITTIMVLSWTAGGVRSPAIYIIPVVILMAGIMLGWREGIITGIISIVFVLGLVVAEYSNYLPTSAVSHSSLSLAINIAVASGLLGWLQFISISKLDNMVKEVNHELTYRRKTEEELRISEAFRRRVFESSRIPIVVMDADSYKYIECNQAAVNIYHCSNKDEVLGKIQLDFSAPVQYDGTPSIDKAKYYIEKALAEGSSVFNWKHQRPDGEFWNAEVHLMSFRTDDRQLLQFTLLDITQRNLAEEALKISEEKFRNIFELSVVGISLTTLNGEIKANNAFYNILGYSKEELSNKKWQDITDPVSIKNDQKIIDSILAGEKESEQWEKKYIHKDGNIVWVNISTTLQRDDRGEPLYFITVIIDVTERKLTEEALIENKEKLIQSEQRLSYALNASSDALWEWNYLTGQTYYNSRWYEILGYKDQEFEMTFDTWKKLCHPDDFDPTLEKISEVIINPDSRGFNAEFRMLHKNGKWFWILARGNVVIRDENQKPILLSGTHTDINERKIAEHELRISRQQFKNIVDASPMGMHLYELKSNDSLVFIGANSAADKILGVDHIQFIGKTIEEAFPGLIPTEVPIRYKDTALNGTQWNTQQIDYNEGIIRGAFEVVAFQTEPGKMAALFFDITERKQAEEALLESESRFRIMLQDVENIAVQGYAPDGTTQYWNRASERLYGYTAQEAIGRNLLDLIIPPEMRDGVEQAIKLIAVSREPIPASELLLMRKDNSRVPVFSSHVIVQIPGRQQELFCIDLDLTERKKAEAELEIYHKHLEELVKLKTEEWEAANEELKLQLEKQKEYELMLQNSLEKEKELNEMKSRFISTTSHEFRTPLTSVLSSAELIKRYTSKWSDEKKNEHLDRIKSSVLYLTKLLDDVLTISRTETGKIGYNPDSLDLRNFAQECAKDASTLLTEKHQFMFDFNSQRSVFNLDLKLMRFILNNLLSNAIKYSPEGGTVKLSISTEGKNLIIQVSDEGIGLTPEDSGKIFESFYRSKNVENISGTGLGLAIVKRAVELHYGEIVVESQPGKGSTFYVKIPIDSAG